MTGTGALRGFVPLVALAVALGGCGGGAGEMAGAPAEGTGAGVLVKNFIYSPIPADVDRVEACDVHRYLNAKIIVG